jgi:hypothetical protein
MAIFIVKLPIQSLGSYHLPLLNGKPFALAPANLFQMYRLCLFTSHSLPFVFEQLPAPSLLLPFSQHLPSKKPFSIPNTKEYFKNFL